MVCRFRGRHSTLCSQMLTLTLTHIHTHSLTHPPTHSPTHALTHALTLSLSLSLTPTYSRPSKKHRKTDHRSQERTRRTRDIRSTRFSTRFPTNVKSRANRERAKKTRRVEAFGDVQPKALRNPTAIRRTAIRRRVGVRTLVVNGVQWISGGSKALGKHVEARGCWWTPMAPRIGTTCRSLRVTQAKLDMRL